MWRGALIAVCLLAAALIAGCGQHRRSHPVHTPTAVTATATTTTTTTHSSAFTAMSPRAQVAAAAAALSRDRSYTAQEEIDLEGRPAAINVMVQAPSRLAVTISPGAGVVVNIREISRRAWMLANGGFWRLHGGGHLTSAAIARLSGRWFVVPASVVRSLTAHAVDASFAREASCLAAAKVDSTRVGPSHIDGQPAVELHINAGPGHAPGNLWIATASPHQPLRFQQTGKRPAGGSGRCVRGKGSGPTTGDLTFSAFNSTRVTAPSGATALP